MSEAAINLGGHAITVEPHVIDIVDKHAHKFILVQICIEKMFKHDPRTLADHAASGMVIIEVLYEDAPARGIFQEFKGKTKSGFNVSLCVPLLEAYQRPFKLHVRKPEPEDLEATFEATFDGYQLTNTPTGVLVDPMPAAEASQS